MTAQTQGKVIILTGASRGIGRAIAQYLLERQCRLVVIARSKAPLDELRTSHPSTVEVLANDLSDFSVGKKAVDLAISTWGQIDGLIVNHGVLSPVKRISDVDAEEWRHAFDVNVFSAVALVQAALPALRKSHGRIVLTSSGAASAAYSTWGSYGASKAVLNHLAATLAVEEPDITSVSIRPGVVDTEMQREVREHSTVMDKKDADKFAKLHSSGGLLKPEQPAKVMGKLVLDARKELSGKYFSWDDKELAKYHDT